MTLAEEDKAAPYIEVSGRKGFGVKADDLLDKLIAAAQSEVDARHPELDDDRAAARSPTQIAIGALRYFMLKFTQEFGDRLRLQRGAQLRRRDRAVRAVRGGARTQHLPQGGDRSRNRRWPSRSSYASFFAGDVRRTISGRCGLRRRSSRRCSSSASRPPSRRTWPSMRFSWRRQFNNFYHRHHILTEDDAGRKKFLLATAAVVRRELIRALDVMGIDGSAGDVTRALRGCLSPRAVMPELAQRREGSRRGCTADEHGSESQIPPRRKERRQISL